MPGAFVGMFYTFKKVLRGGADVPAIYFVLLFVLVNVQAVVVTSLEVRHVGLAIPAIILLAVVPSRKDPVAKLYIRRVAAVWVGAIFVGHIFWALLKMF